MERVTVVCFLASYLLALGLELWHQFRPRPVLRLFALVAGGAGLLAQTIYLAVQRPPLAYQFGYLLSLAWVLAVFYLYGSLHHARLAWGIFVLPLVLGLVGLGGLGALLDRPPPAAQGFRADHLFSFQVAHAAFLLLAAVGLCVGFVASLMYLVQAHRLRAKLPPNKGLRLLSLERLEVMNRRAVNLAFPLWSIGLIIGGALLVGEKLQAWHDLRILATLVTTVVFGLLVWLRYSHHLRGRQLALLTVATFALLLCCLTLSHPSGQGVGR
jgi:hypothetical protein